MSARATYTQSSLPASIARCDLCGALVDPSETGRVAHTEHHEWITGIEVALRALLAAIERPHLDLTREEQAATIPAKSARPEAAFQPCKSS
jgi:hypothetical protein